MGVDVLRVLPAHGTTPLRLTREEASALLESAYLATAANGDLSDEEADSVRALVPKIHAMTGGSELDASRGGVGAPSDVELRKLLDGFDANLRHTEVADRLRVLAAAMPRPELRELAYKLAFALSLCDLATDSDEEDFLDALADAFALDARVDGLTAEAYAALDGDETSDGDEGPASK